MAIVIFLGVSAFILLFLVTIIVNPSSIILLFGLKPDVFRLKKKNNDYCIQVRVFYIWYYIHKHYNYYELYYFYNYYSLKLPEHTIFNKDAELMILELEDIMNYFKTNN